MKLTQGIRDKIIEAYCTKKYHAVINTLNMEFENAVTEAVKKLFSKFDFEKAKELYKEVAEKGIKLYMGKAAQEKILELS